MRCGVGDVGSIALGKGLSGNKTLRILNLYSSCVQEEGAKAIGKALEINIRKNK